MPPPISGVKIIESLKWWKNIMVRNIVNNFPLWLIFACAIASAILMVFAFFAIKKRYWPFLLTKDHNDMTVVLVRVLSALYTILLGLTIVNLWLSFNDAKKHVILEANNYRQVIDNTNHFPSSARNTIQYALSDYIKSMITEDWQNMRKGLPESEAVVQAIHHVYKSFANFEPKRNADKLFYHQMLESFNNALDERAQRLSKSQSSAPAGIRLLMFINVVALILAMCLLGSNYFKAQRNKVALVSSIIMMSLVLAFILDYPYAGPIAVKPTALETLIKGS